MIINDKVYGKFDIGDSVLVDLINCPSIQRLKGVSQMGMPGRLWRTPVYSRYDHSLGVALFLRSLGASLEEQVAGVIHDVSHTAFSHVIDWVVGDPTKEDYQDNTFRKVVKDSEIPEIVQRYGFDIERLCNEHNFKLLENEAPGICADRFDYSMREGSFFMDGQDVEEILDNVYADGDEIVFRSKEVAEKFANNYVWLQKNNWAGDDPRARYYLLASAIKKGMELGVINREDFMKKDEEILQVLEEQKDPYINHIFNLLSRPLEVEEAYGEGAVVLHKKPRYVDPAIQQGHFRFTLRELSGDYKDTVSREMINFPRRIKIGGFNANGN